MRGRIFTQVPKPASAARRAPDPVRKRSPWMRESFKARPGQSLPYYVDISPGPAGVQTKPTTSEPERLPEERPDHPTAPATFVPSQRDRPASPDTNPPPSRWGGKLSGSLVLQRHAEAEEAPFQAKLTVGAPNDHYEQEADRVTEQVMGMRLSPVNRGSTALPQQSAPTHAPGLQNKPLAITPRVQRQTDNEENEDKQALQTSTSASQAPAVTSDVASRVNALQGGGTTTTFCNACLHGTPLWSRFQSGAYPRGQ